MKDKARSMIESQIQIALFLHRAADEAAVHSLEVLGPTRAEIVKDNDFAVSLNQLPDKAAADRAGPASDEYSLSGNEIAHFQMLRVNLGCPVFLVQACMPPPTDRTRS
jgi:hypothetical protein